MKPAVVNANGMRISPAIARQILAQMYVAHGFPEESAAQMRRIQRVEWDSVAVPIQRINADFSPRLGGPMFAGIPIVEVDSMPQERIVIVSHNGEIIGIVENLFVPSE